MSLRAFCLCALLLRFHPIFGPRAVAASAAPGTVKLYDDYDCNQISTLNPTVSLPLSTCLVTTGGEGLVIAELPACSSGTAAMIYYSDTACGVQTNNVSPSITSDSCFSLAEGEGIYNAKSVMFSCQPAADNPQPSSTTTAVVSRLAAVATGSSDSTGSGSSSSATGSTPTHTSASGDGTSGSGSSSNSNSNSNSNNATISAGSGSGSGLNMGDIIALAVGLGIGIPTMLIGLAAWLFPRSRLGHEVRRLLPVGQHQRPPAFQQHAADQWYHNPPQEVEGRPQGFQRWQKSGPQAQEMDSMQQPLRTR